MATHFSILAWRIPRTEETGELQSMGSQKELDTTERLSLMFYTHTHVYISNVLYLILDTRSYTWCLFCSSWDSISLRSFSPFFLPLFIDIKPLTEKGFYHHLQYLVLTVPSWEFCRVGLENLT